jgi:hypothetical protein
VTAPVQYGPRITAIILYLYVGQFLSTTRTAQALAELFGTPVSDATVARMTRRAAQGLDKFLDQVKDRIAEAKVAGSMRPSFGCRASCTGCIAPAPTNTP